jgi:peptidoglycan/LPS O-acetylase OafA/YrhL
VDGQRLNSLTGLRFVAAFVVFLCHAQVLFGGEAIADGLARFTAQGSVGVSFFYILSGFVLAWSHRDNDRPGAFYRRRFARVAPAYLVALAAGILLRLYFERAQGFAALWRSLPSILALQAWVPNPSVYYAGNVVGWSISCEVFFYAVFPLVVLAKPAVMRRWWPAVTALLLLTAIAPLILRPTDDLSVATWAIYILPVQRITEFLLGVLIAWAIRRGWRPRVSFGHAAALCLVAYLAAGWAPLYARLVLITLVPLALLISSAAIADIEGRTTRLCGRWFQRLGEWSFAFYLVHHMVLKVADRVVEQLGPTELVSTAATLVALVAAVAVAALLYRFVEAPLERRLRRARPRPDMVAAS